MSKTPEQTLNPLRERLFWFALGLLLLLTIGRYHGKDLVLGEQFQWLRFLLYTVGVFLIAKLSLRTSLKDCGFGLPRISRRLSALLIVCALLLPAIISVILLSPDYLRAYSFYRNPEISPGAKLSHFAQFIFSTLPAWTFLLRGVILFGVSRYLIREHKMKDRSAELICLLVVMGIEVIYHFLKPEFEAFGMLVASPVLSWLALRTRSVWTPFFVHLYLETCFIFILIWG